MSLYLGTQKISDVNTHFEGYEGVKQEKTVSPSESIQVVTPDAGADALSKVTVNRIPLNYVGSGIPKQAAKTITPSATTQTAVAANRYTSGAITVAPVPAISTTITSGGTYYPPSGAWFNEVVVDVVEGGVLDGDVIVARNVPFVRISDGENFVLEDEIYNAATVGIYDYSSVAVADFGNHTDFLELLIEESLSKYVDHNNIIVSFKHIPLNIDRHFEEYDIIYSFKDGYVCALSTFDVDMSFFSMISDDYSMPNCFADIYYISDGVEQFIQNKIVTPTESTQIVKSDSGFVALGEVTVQAIPSDYVGSAIPRKSSTDLTVSAAKVTVPAGYYAAEANKSVATGTAGTPTATKGTVTNHSISITPSVRNEAGFITSATKTGTPVTVSASELVSGNKELVPSESEQTNIDVTNYATASVAAIPDNYIGSAIPNQIQLIGSSLPYQVWGGSWNILRTAYDIGYVNEGDEVEVYLGLAGMFGEAELGDVLYGKTFSSRFGINREGTMPSHTSGTTTFASITKSGTNMVVASGIPTDGYGYYSSNAAISTSIPASNFGTATAANVLSGTTFTSESGVKIPGTLVVQKCYKGSTDPSNSIGENGDLYLVTG